MRVIKVNGVDYPISINARAERLFQEKTGKWFIETIQAGSESARMGTAAALVWAVCCSRGDIKATFEDFEMLDLGELTEVAADIAVELEAHWARATESGGPLERIVDLVMSAVNKFQTSVGGLSGRLAGLGLDSEGGSTSTPSSGT